MDKRLIQFITAIMAAAIVMILHELPKSLLYCTKEGKLSKKSLYRILSIQHYIDPIGVVLCVTTFAGFSKPHMYRIKNKSLNKALGITGFISLAVIYLISVFVLKHVFGLNHTMEYRTSISLFEEILLYLFCNISFISFGMFLVNLFPIATFDMGNLIAGISPVKFFDYVRKDYFTKIILIFILMLGIVTDISEMVLRILLG